jgi:hypothetical protein
MLRLRLIRLVPFLGRYLEMTAGCCGACPTCVGLAATGLTIEAVREKSEE